MFSLHSFFFLFSPTSEFVPATVFLVAIFLALRLCVSMTQMTILADFFPHQCTVWQWTDTTWGDLQAGLVTAPEANLPVPSGACLSFTCRWLNGTCLPLPPPSPTHTHTAGKEKSQLGPSFASSHGTDCHHHSTHTHAPGKKQLAHKSSSNSWSHNYASNQHTAQKKMSAQP